MDAGGTGMYRLRRSARPFARAEGTRRWRANKRGRRPLVTLGLSKVTRQAAQRRRNLVEDGVLVSCIAEPCHSHVGRHCTKQ